MGLSNALRAQILDTYFGDGNDSSFTVPATLHVGLSSTTPAPDGTNVTEPSTNGYARVSVDNSGADEEWTAATVADPSVKDNAAAITFPESTGAWLAGAALTHFVIYDAATAGTFIGFGALDTSRTVDASGITLEFAIGALNINLDDADTA